MTADFTAVARKPAAARPATKADIAALKGDMRAMFADLRALLNLLTWLAGGLYVGLAVLIANQLAG